MLQGELSAKEVELMEARERALVAGRRASSVASGWEDALRVKDRAVKRLELAVGALREELEVKRPQQERERTEGALRAQARKYEEVVKGLEARVREMEGRERQRVAERASAEREGLQAAEEAMRQVGVAEGEVARADAEVAEMRVRCGALEAEAEGLRRRVGVLEEEVRVEVERRGRAEAEGRRKVEEAERRAESAEEGRGRAEAERARVGRELEGVRKEADEAAREAARERSEGATWRQKAGALEAAEAERDAAAASTAGALRRQVEALRGEVEEARGRGDRLQRERDAAVREAGTLREACEDAEAGAVRARAEVAELQKALRDCDHSETVASLAEELRASKGRILELAREVEVRRERRHEEQGEHLRQMQADHDAKVKALQHEHERISKDLRERLAEAQAQRGDGDGEVAKLRESLRKSEAQKRLTEKTFIEQLRAKGARIAELQAFQRELEQVVHRMSRAQGPTPHREWDHLSAAKPSAEAGPAPADQGRTPLRPNYR